MAVGRRRAATGYTLVIVGPTSPPVHGTSRVTDEVIGVATATAAPGGRVVCVPTGGPGLTRTLRYHAVRVRAHARAARAVLRSRLTGPVVLYIAGAGGLGLAYQAGLVLLARVTGVRTVFHHHSYNYLRGPRSAWMRVLCRLLGPGDTHVMLTDHMIGRFTTRYATRARVVRVSNAFAVSDDAPRVGGRDGASRRLIHVSNLSAEKGTDLVLDAFEELLRRGRPYTLTLVGAALDGQLRQRIRRLETAFPDALRHAGQQDPDGVLAHLDAAHLMVFPSRYKNEAEPVVVLESLARGVPALVSRQGSMVTMVPRDWQVQPGASLPDEIERVLAEDWSALSARARMAFECRRSDVQVLVRWLHAPAR